MACSAPLGSAGWTFVASFLTTSVNLPRSPLGSFSSESFWRPLSPSQSVPNLAWAALSRSKFLYSKAETGNVLPPANSAGTPAVNLPKIGPSSKTAFSIVNGSVCLRICCDQPPAPSMLSPRKFAPFHQSVASPVVGADLERNHLAIGLSLVLGLIRAAGLSTSQVAVLPMRRIMLVQNPPMPTFWPFISTVINFAPSPPSPTGLGSSLIGCPNASANAM